MSCWRRPSIVYGCIRSIPVGVGEGLGAAEGAGLGLTITVEVIAPTGRLLGIARVLHAIRNSAENNMPELVFEIIVEGVLRLSDCQAPFEELNLK